MEFHTSDLLYILTTTLPIPPPTRQFIMFSLSLILENFQSKFPPEIEQKNEIRLLFLLK